MNLTELIESSISGALSSLDVRRGVPVENCYRTTKKPNCPTNQTFTELARYIKPCQMRVYLQRASCKP